MVSYLLSRLVGYFVVLLIVSTIAFGMIRIVPGDFVTSNIARSGSVPEERLSGIRHELGLDRPVYTQYFVWLGDAVQGDFGKSLVTSRPVTDELRERLPATIELAVAATVLSALIGVTLGVVAAVRANSPIDLAARSIAVAGVSIPSFWVGTLAITLPALWWGWIRPANYRDFWEDPWVNLQQVWMPVVILAFAFSADIMRVTRSSMLEVLHQDYIRTARAKGLTDLRVVIGHALRNALIPVVTVVGLQFAFLLSGEVIMEQIFAIPGIGQRLVTATVQRDYPVLQGGVLVIATGFVLINFLVDLSYAYLDPRLKR
ncbi:MAG: ABC transporter permease [Dehalococcoidia bacterium]